MVPFCCFCQLHNYCYVVTNFNCRSCTAIWDRVYEDVSFCYGKEFLCLHYRDSQPKSLFLDPPMDGPDCVNTKISKFTVCCKVLVV